MLCASGENLSMSVTCKATGSMASLKAAHKGWPYGRVGWGDEGQDFDRNMMDCDTKVVENRSDRDVHLRHL